MGDKISTIIDNTENNTLLGCLQKLIPSSNSQKSSSLYCLHKYLSANIFDVNNLNRFGIG